MSTQIRSIEVLKRTLLALEAETLETRKQLQQLLMDKEKRSCHAVIRWDTELQTYCTLFYSKNNELLFSFNTKKYSRSLATAGIELANGLRPRVSWKDIDAGKTWDAQVLIHDWYWQEHFCKKSSSSAQVIHLSIFRDALKNNNG
ncbi:MAG: hypothetical protein IT287_07530 [Bdellovibrionaceae bacterium]|nr:hypothetical protein [Pseudobdellovibrionaceae bacterium]